MWIVDIMSKAFEELRRQRLIHHPSVRGQLHGHGGDGARGEACPCTDPRGRGDARDAASDREDACLRRVDHRGKVGHAVHALQHTQAHTVPVTRIYTHKHTQHK